VESCKWFIFISVASAFHSSQWIKGIRFWYRYNRGQPSSVRSSVVIKKERHCNLNVMLRGQNPPCCVGVSESLFTQVRFGRNSGLMISWDTRGFGVGKAIFSLFYPSFQPLSSISIFTLYIFVKPSLWEYKLNTSMVLLVLFALFFAFRGIISHKVSQHGEESRLTVQ
jgi:hypothetical protein